MNIDESCSFESPPHILRKASYLLMTDTLFFLAEICTVRVAAFQLWHFLGRIYFHAVDLVKGSSKQ